MNMATLPQMETTLAHISSVERKCWFAVCASLHLQQIIIHAQNYNEIGGKSAHQPICLHTVAVIYFMLDFYMGRQTNLKLSRQYRREHSRAK